MATRPTMRRPTMPAPSDPYAIKSLLFWLTAFALFFIAVTGLSRARVKRIIAETKSALSVPFEASLPEGISESPPRSTTSITAPKEQVPAAAPLPRRLPSTPPTHPP